jgi:hypothetical protein
MFKLCTTFLKSDSCKNFGHVTLYLISGNKIDLIMHIPHKVLNGGLFGIGWVIN